MNEKSPTCANFWPAQPRPNPSVIPGITSITQYHPVSAKNPRTTNHQSLTHHSLDNQIGIYLKGHSLLFSPKNRCDFLWPTGPAPAFDVLTPQQNFPLLNVRRSSAEAAQHRGRLGADVPELRQARGLWQLNRLDEALELFERAVKKYPQNLLALVDCSRALGARFEITRAEAMLDRLASLAARNPQLLHLAGQSYRMIFRPEKAIQCFERVLSKGRPFCRDPRNCLR